MRTKQSGRESRSIDTRPPLHPVESTLLGVTVLHLCFLPWALGTMHPWSQITSVGLAMIGFLLAMLPRQIPLARHAAHRVRPFDSLIRWPGFWGGLALLAYVSVQGWNPSWQYVSNEVSWWLEPLPHPAWLPSGIKAPFNTSNAWRELVVYASLWLVACSVWIGFTRRQSYRVLFTALSVNTGILGLLGLLQRLTGTTQIFWSYAPSNARFTASFIYPNHAGAYLNLMVALTLGLAIWSYRRSRLKLEGPGHTLMFAVVSIIAAFTVVSSFSRASIVLMLAFAAGAVAALGLGWVWNLFAKKTAKARLVPFAVVLASLIAVSVTVLNSEKAMSRLTELLANPELAMKSRLQAREAAWTMFQDRWILGWGAGSFRHGFPLYAQDYPAIHSGGRQFWEHAHNDVVEIPLELGFVGILPVLLVALHGVFRIVRRRLWMNPVSLSMITACGFLLVHASVDFVLQCPAVLITAAVFFVGAQRWPALDGSGQSALASGSKS